MSAHEDHARIREPNRQLVRRAARGEVTCCRCGTTVSPVEVVFDQDRAGHRSCAEALNALIDQMNRQHDAEDLEALGLHAPPTLLLP